MDMAGKMMANIDSIGKAMEDLRNEFKQDCKKHGWTCRNACCTYDSIDKDCDVFGIYHPSFSNCFLAYGNWLEERHKKRAAEESEAL